MFFSSYVVALFVLLSGNLGEARPGDFLSAESVEADLQEAMGTALGMAANRLPQIVKALAPIFSVLPKNNFGRIERSMLRYALHRHFQRQYNVIVRGLEPTQNMLGAKALVTAEGIFRDRAPIFIEGVLEGRFFKNGFDLEDAAAIAAVLEELVLEVPGLETAPKNGKSFSRQELEALLDGYVLQWMVGGDQSAQHLNETEAEEIIPKWKYVKDFTRGEIERLLHQRRQSGQGNAFSLDGFTVSDFQQIVKSITSGFGAWWEQECQAIKKNLIAMDTVKTGRAALSDFYHKSVDGEWRFSESTAYLRELGALDESSKTNGPQVMIPNYLLGASNCIGTSTYYHVCCVNECEGLLGEVELAVEGPVASAKAVFAAVVNVTEEEDRGHLFGHLEQQLHRIAKAHKEKIPLHGRLFGQWMHRAFPRECPFPHSAGSIQPRAPLDFGEEYIVTAEEIQQHTKKARNHQRRSPDASAVENVWGSELEVQDEELLTEYMELGSTGLGGRLGQALVGGTAPVLAGAAVFFLLVIVLQDQFHGDSSGAAKGSSVLTPRQQVFV